MRWSLPPRSIRLTLAAEGSRQGPKETTPAASLGLRRAAQRLIERRKSGKNETAACFVICKNLQVKFYVFNAMNCRCRLTQ
jgi:hypothetical protein